MQVVRTIVWIVITAILVAFLALNWGDPAPVKLWPLEDENAVHFQWPVGVIALVFFFLGFAPMWLFHRARRWQLNRRIASLENSLRVAATVAPISPPDEPATEAIEERANEVT